MTIEYQLNVSLENEYVNKKTPSWADKLRIRMKIAATRYSCILSPLDSSLSVETTVELSYLKSKFKISTIWVIHALYLGGAGSQDAIEREIYAAISS